MIDGKYTFLPWVKAGFSNAITQLQTEVGANGRASVPVQLTLKHNENDQDYLVEKTIEFRGPGDILKIDPSMIMRVEPLDGIKNLEANYLPVIEFYDADFLWRYTPGRAASEPGAGNTPGFKLRPWLYLAALKPDEFELLNTSSQYPSIQLLGTAAEAFVNPTDTWAFAHVQSNIQFETGDPFQEQVLEAIKENANAAFCRLISPRKLEAGQEYHMFLVPAFEAGRQTGLDPNFDFSGTPSLKMAWSFSAGNEAVLPDLMPFYHRWQFTTDERGDFETLADKILPKATPPETGTRPMDIAHSGWDVTCDEETQKVMGLESALMPPLMESKEFIDVGYNHTYVNRLKQLINANEPDKSLDDLPSNDFRSPDDPSLFWLEEDPVVVPPLYGQWHALQKRINFPVPIDEATAPESGTGASGWLDELNLDPRWRMTAGIGSDIVKENQEEFMEEAWEQVDEVNRANQRIRMAQLTTKVSQTIFEKNIKHSKNNSTKANDDLLRMTSNYHRSVLIEENKTVEKNLGDSKIPNASLTGAFRKATRPGLRRNMRLNLGASLNGHFTEKLVNDFNGTNVEQSSLSNYYKAAVPADAQGLVGYANDGAVTKDGALYDTAVAELKDKLSPKNAVKNLVLSTIEIWDDVTKQFKDAEELKPIMAYPDFNVPLYEYLEKISTDYIIPNVDKIEPNSATLMTLNTRFIEALFAGANHEMSRELLWREYPTDMRGTYFKNFWDQSDDGLDDYVAEIDEIHNWDKTKKLGTQDLTVSATMILVIRAELLDKFPDVQIYAQPATWDNVELPSEPSAIDERTPRIVDEGKAKIFPNLRARVGSEIVLLGFDLTEEQARGINSIGNFDNYGHFFVFRERPGKVRFGLDDDPEVVLADNVGEWDNMSWQRNGINSTYVNVNENVIGPFNSTILWGKSSADMAHILFQKPVQMMIHASEMLMPSLNYDSVEEVE